MSTTSLVLMMFMVVMERVTFLASVDTKVGGGIDPSNMSDEKRLIKELLHKYDSVGVVGRPVFNHSQTIRVKYGISLIQILDLNEKDQVLTTNVWSRYTWTDVMLTWDPDWYGGIEEVRVPVTKIWKPDIVLYNYADTRLTEHRDAMAIIQYHGEVLWMPAAIFRSTCPVNIFYFPFDRQECRMKFGSWTYDGFKLDLLFHEESMGRIDTDSYVESNLWRLLAVPAKRNVVQYPCCAEPYLDLTFFIVIQRIPIFHMIILIVPCFLLTLLTLVSFWLPPETPAKILLGMNIFLAFFLLLKLLASTTPSSSDIPLIGAFFCVNMILITLSSFLSATIINLYMRADKKNKVPKWLRKIAVDGLSRMLCMEQRKNVVVKKKTRRDHVTHHVTHVIDDRGAADGGGRGGKFEKTIKSPVLPYNKWEPAAPVITGYGTSLGVGHQLTHGKGIGGGSGRSAVVSGGGGPRSDSPIQIQNPFGYGTLSGDGAMTNSVLASVNNSTNGAVETEVREIKRVLRTFMTKLQNRDVKEKIALEWRLVALSIDRLFFIIYLTTITVTMTTIALTRILQPTIDYPLNVTYISPSEQLAEEQ